MDGIQGQDQLYSFLGRVSPLFYRSGNPFLMGAGMLGGLMSQLGLSGGGSGGGAGGESGADATQGGYMGVRRSSPPIKMAGSGQNGQPGRTTIPFKAEDGYTDSEFDPAERFKEYIDPYKSKKNVERRNALWGGADHTAEEPPDAGIRAGKKQEIDRVIEDLEAEISSLEKMPRLEKISSLEKMPRLEKMLEKISRLKKELKSRGTER